MVDERDVQTVETELAGGQILRVSSVSRRRGGRTLVLEKLPGSVTARSLVDPPDGPRLVLDMRDAPHLRELLDEVTNR